MESSGLSSFSRSKRAQASPHSSSPQIGLRKQQQLPLELRHPAQEETTLAPFPCFEAWASAPARLLFLGQEGNPKHQDTMRPWGGSVCVGVDISNPCECPAKSIFLGTCAFIGTTAASFWFMDASKWTASGDNFPFYFLSLSGTPRAKDDIVQCAVPERLGQNGVSVDPYERRWGEQATLHRQTHTHIHTSAKAGEEKEAG